MQTVAVLKNGEQERRTFGLTGAQLTIALIVFAAVVMSFSWALTQPLARGCSSAAGSRCRTVERRS
jgi:hypothetical protein